MSEDNKKEALSKTALIEYAKKFVNGAGKKAVESVGFNQEVSGHFAAFVLAEEGQIEAGQRKEVAGLLNSHGLGGNASQLRKVLVDAGVVASNGKTSSVSDLID